MFSKGLNKNIYSEAGEDFAARSVRKKGRSLSQTSFLFGNNFIPLPQSFELIDKKKTLAFAPSFKWHRENNVIANHEQRSFNYDSSENNFCSTSSTQINSNQNLLFVTENNSQLSKITRPQDDSCTDLSTSYRYNPISLENQLCLSVSRDEDSTPSSFTSVKHHILENIPINLISNLSIFLNNKNNYPSFITSKSNVYQKNDVPSKNYRTSLAISGSKVTLQDEWYFRGKSQNLNRSFVYQRRTGYQQNQLDESTSCSKSQSKYNQVVILKPASDSLSVTYSSESVIMNTEGENRPFSETTLDSKSVFSPEDNNLRVHYMNYSETNESEYSLLISKGYTFADKQRSKGSPKRFNIVTEEQRDSCESFSDKGSSHTAETELRVINFLDYDVDNGKEKETNLRKDSVSACNLNHPGSKYTLSSTLDQGAFLSCDSVIRSSPVSNPQQSSHVIQQKSAESEYSVGQRSSKKSIRGRSDKLLVKGENPKRLQESLQRKFRNGNKVSNCGFDTKEDVTSVQEPCDESLYDEKNLSIRNAVERIHDRLMKHVDLFDIERDSISETYTALSNEISLSYNEDDVESISEESFTHHSDPLLCSDDYVLRSNRKFRKFPCSKYLPHLKIPKQPRKYEHSQIINFRDQNFSDISSAQSFIPQLKRKTVKRELKNFTDHNRDLKFKKTSRRKNQSISSRSSSKVRLRYSRCSVTSNLTNFSVHRPGYRSITGRSRSSSTYFGRNKVKDKKVSTESFSKKSKAHRKTGRMIRKSNKPKGAPSSAKKGFYSHKSRGEEVFNSSKEAGNIDLKKGVDIAPVLCEFQELSSGERKTLICTNSKQVVMNFMDQKEIINLIGAPESRVITDQNTSCDNNCEIRPFDGVIKEKVSLPFEKDDEKIPNNNRKLGNNFLVEMDVYTRNDKKRPTILKDREKTIRQQLTLEYEVKNAVFSHENESLFERKEACQSVSSAKEVCSVVEPKDSVHHERDERYLYPPAKTFNSLSTDDALSSSNSRKLANSKVTKISNSDNDICDESSKFVILSKHSVFSDVSTPYDPSCDDVSTLLDSESNHSICDSTSEYISWAKNCIFKQRNGAFEVHHDFPFLNGKEDQHQLKHVSEAGDGANQIQNAHTCHQDNFSSYDRRVGLDDSICRHFSKMSNESESTTDTKSALSIIPEEKDGSSERLKSSLSSRMNSTALRQSKQSLRCSDHSVQQPNGSINPECIDDCRDNIFRTKELVKRARKQKLKNKSKKSSILSSDSEEDYRKFKEEMNHYSKSAASAQITPRIIPSSSTFTPDLSSTLVNWNC